MKNLLKIAVIAAAIALPQFTVAQDSSTMRFPPIPMEKLTAKQKAWFLARIKARDPRNSEEVLEAIDAFVSDARSVT